MKRLRFVLSLALVVGMLNCFSPAPAQAGSRPSPIVSAELGPIEPEELESFLDEFFAVQMAKHHAPDAVFVLVKDGEIFLSKGYGFADVEKGTPVCRAGS